MTKITPRKIALIFLLLLIVAAVQTFAQSATTPFSTDAGARYWVQPDIVYNTANNTPLKLDVWYPNASKTPTPTLVYIHGGGWVFGSKETSILEFLPFLEKGWRVVNVEYRMASNSLAPAAVEDTRCALRWVFRNAKQWNFDTSKIVLTGHSAGGHLSLITGMLPIGTRLDNACYGDEDLKVAAIINWYGISDVGDLITGPNLKNYAIMWMGSQANAAEIARNVSPLTYVRAGLPPIISIHGNKDDVVPYAQSVRLHKALTEAKVVNRLITIPEGGHGGFTQPEFVRAYDAIWKFLKDNKISE
ncbi:MAG: alpha/beta fold hydrolase [Pyrinomonadaceae bacterium]